MSTSYEQSDASGATGLKYESERMTLNVPVILQKDLDRGDQTNSFTKSI